MLQCFQLQQHTDHCMKILSSSQLRKNIYFILMAQHKDTVLIYEDGHFQLHINLILYSLKRKKFKNTYGLVAWLLIVRQNGSIKRTFLKSFHSFEVLYSYGKRALHSKTYC